MHHLFVIDCYPFFSTTSANQTKQTKNKERENVQTYHLLIFSSHRQRTHTDSHTTENQGKETNSNSNTKRQQQLQKRRIASSLVLAPHITHRSNSKHTRHVYSAKLLTIFLFFSDVPSSRSRFFETREVV